MDRIIYSKKQSPDTKKVSEFCFLNYIILQTISIIRMATDELPCSAKWLIRLLTLNSHKFPYLPPLQFLFIQFYYFAVVCHQSVHFDLNICSLCINSSRESACNHILQHISILQILISSFFGSTKLNIPPNYDSAPKDAPSALNQFLHTLRVQLHAVRHINTSPDRDNYANRAYHHRYNDYLHWQDSLNGRIILLCPFCYFRGFKLPPSLIERYPCANTRIRVKAVDNFFPFFTINSL